MSSTPDTPARTGLMRRRIAGSALASIVVGVAFGVATVVGISAFTGQDTVPRNASVNADEALLGGPEYGSRN